MRKELQEKLYSDFPKIFRQKDMPMQETCMCWGIETPDEWYVIINALCRQLQWDIDNNGEPQIEASQVKEKFNELRFYTDGSTDRQDGAIRFAEIMVDLLESGDIIVNNAHSDKPCLGVSCPYCDEEECDE